MTSLEECLLQPFLNAYVHPACAISISEINANGTLKSAPCWTNVAFNAHLPEDILSRASIVDLIHGTLSLHRAHANPDPDVCSVPARHWTYSAAVVTSFLIITTSPRNYSGDTPDDHAFSPSTNLFPRESMVVSPRIVDLWSRTQMGKLILEFPWDSTPVGPITLWSPELVMIVTLMLEWPERLCLWLGEDSIAVYNDQYLKVLGPRKHINMLGKPYREVFPELWVTHESRVQTATSGERVYVVDGLLLMDRERPEADETSWGLEETYHNWSFTPLRVGSKVIGFANESQETTARVVAERRMATIVEIGIATSSAMTREEFYSGAYTQFTNNSLDFPFVIMYAVHNPCKAKQGASAEQGPATKQTRLKLHGKIGVPDGHPFAPQDIEFSHANASTETVVSASDTTSMPSDPLCAGVSTFPEVIWPFAECLAEGESVLVSSLGLNADTLDSRSWGRHCKSAVMFPLGVKGDWQMVMIIGLNPCRPFNAVYRDYVKLVKATLSTGLTTVTNIETAATKAEALASLDRAKTVFFSNVTHELRTPLTLILAPLEDIIAEDSIISGPKAPHVRSQLNMVLRHTRRLLQLVNSLLDFARLAAGRFLAMFRPVNLPALTTDLASLFRSAIERGGIEYIVSCDPGPEVVLDVDAWEKVVTNIISNAFKYTLRGRIIVKIEYTTTHAVFSCSDTGVGIPEADLGQIFQRFHRVESCMGRSIEGTGVGLALTFETVKSLGGHIDVQSQFGIGSIFTVSLPLGTDHIPSERLAPESESLEQPARNRDRLRYGHWMAEEAHGWLSTDSVGLISSPNGHTQSGDGANGNGNGTVGESDPSQTAWTLMSDDERERGIGGSTILVCDDNHDLRDYCANLLRSTYNVISFPDGGAAHEYILSNDVDLILSDVHMPRMNGFELLQHVRSQQSTALIPFILLSAAAGMEANLEGITAGADDFLVKPFKSKDLLARVRRQLLVGGMRRDLEARVQSRTKLLVESEARLLQQITESEHMRKQQEIVVDLTSHEIRNPLNAIWQNADLIGDVVSRLRRKFGDQATSLLNDADDAVQSISLSVAHQTRIADDILNFSKISMNLLTLHRAPFPLHETVQNVLRWWDLEMKERDINVEITTSPELRDRWIISDSQRVTQVLINFLINAIRFTSDTTMRKITVFMNSSDHLHEPTSYRVCTVDEDFEHDGPWLTIGVADSGCGLSPEDRVKLFERFAQAHPSKDQFTGGHGLGLFVSRHITTLLDGVIDVESVKGQGSTFSFTIPVTFTERPPDDAQNIGRRLSRAVPPLNSHPWPSRPRAKSTPSKRHILVVEDNVINQKVLSRQLQSRGFHTSVAGDGQEALNAIQDPKFDGDLVLMDIEMPVKDGRTACRELRVFESLGGLQRLPVVAVTGNARAEQIQECLDAGFDDVAIKPYQIKDLVSMIERILGSETE
ncbi:hypothetical protein BKA62DRAFT_640120 [Auriculariales sp. MPI-PUGE-AT-0066]|nr:hypothetical protein BKA62DRAFT_640120 [Auriculariales sp. MPI-PUGE-AT-0066]